MSGGRKGAISRLRKELQNFMKDPPPYLSVRPLPSLFDPAAISCLHLCLFSFSAPGSSCMR